MPTEPKQDRNVEFSDSGTPRQAVQNLAMMVGILEAMSLTSSRSLSPMQIECAIDSTITLARSSGVTERELTTAFGEKIIRSANSRRNSRPSQTPQPINALAEFIKTHPTKLSDFPAYARPFLQGYFPNETATTQPPQNVEAGDAAKQAEIDYANRREEDTRPMDDPVKGVVEEIQSIRRAMIKAIDGFTLSATNYEEKYYPYSAPQHVAQEMREALDKVEKLSDRLRLALSATGDDAKPMKMFPIQTERGTKKPHLLSIPWDIAELAYSVYAGRYGRGQSLERLAERGGFGPSEMDEFLPDWRERCSQQQALCDEIDRLKEGDFTPAEFQNLCHSLEGKPGLTREEFCRGCKEYQDKLFGPATGDDARGGDGELAAYIERILERHVKGMVTSGKSLEMTAAEVEALHCLSSNKAAIIAASANAERLKDAEGIIAQARRYIPPPHPLATAINIFLSTAPAQTPGDERQG